MKLANLIKEMEVLLGESEEWSSISARVFSDGSFMLIYENNGFDVADLSSKFENWPDGFSIDWSLLNRLSDSEFEREVVESVEKLNRFVLQNIPEFKEARK
jgi:hypothetical protein